MEAVAFSQVPTLAQPVEAPADQSSNSHISPDTKYCILCTPLGKLCPNEFPVSSDWDKNLKQEERKDQDKGEDNLSVWSNWDADLEEQDRENQEIKDQKNNERKTPQIAPHSCQLLHLLFSPMNPPLNSLLKIQ